IYDWYGAGVFLSASIGNGSME
ncbi:hypothetical protein AZ005_001101, partial [Escherichia coli]